MLARALVRQRSMLLGLVYENPSASYVVELQRGMLTRLANGPYRLVVFPIASIIERSGEVAGLLRSAGLDGVVLAPPAADDLRILNDLAAAGIRCARIGPSRGIELAPSNLVDDITAAREVAAHVIALGHRQVGIIKGLASHAASEARAMGYSQAFFAAGVPMRLDLVEQGDFTQESGHAAAHRLLARPDAPTAILAQNDDMAVGALLAARERGLTVPDDLTLAGFDDSEISRVCWPPLTTVRQPVFDMAVEATDMVIAQLEGRKATARQDHAHQLLVRASSAPPRPAGVG
ncbi:alanine racemase [Sphingomonas sp. Leaf343]|nr:alanine racemase [Sphingomonas sp. Leaf343]